MADPQTTSIVILIGTATISALGGAFGRNLVEMVKSGSKGEKKKDVGDRFDAQGCRLAREKIEKWQHEFEQLLSAHHTTQELILQRMEQTERRLEEGSKNFKLIGDNMEQINLNVALIQKELNNGRK